MLKFHNSASSENYDDDAIANCTNLDGKGGPVSLAIQHVATQFDYKRLYKFVLPVSFKYRRNSQTLIPVFSRNTEAAVT